MRNFSLQTKRNSLRSSAKRRVVRVGAYLVGALLILYLGGTVVGALTSRSVSGFYALRSYFAHSSAALPTYIRSRSAVQAEIDTLQAAVAASSGYRSTIEKLAAENIELRALLNNAEEPRIRAGVIGRPPYTPFDVILLDRGREHGIIEDALVFHENGHSIGLVTRVFETSAIATLFTSPGTETAVYLYGPNVFAYAYGEGGGVLRVSVPQGITVSVGDSVVLPSVDGGDLGMIARVESVPTEPEQRAYVTFPVSIHSIRSVTIATHSHEPITTEDLAPEADRIRAHFLATIPEALRLGTSTSTEGVATSSTSTIP